jgi:hypothetical protein
MPAFHNVENEHMLTVAGIHEEKVHIKCTWCSGHSPSEPNADARI